MDRSLGELPELSFVSTMDFAGTPEALAGSARPFPLSGA
jgi:hypothetical protein